ncbi:hypothetical protein [Ruoffia sp. FAM 26254]|uniref:helix-turn-helix domain-containing protein n=1 Tax=Ruoffia sp. FAM 26254 TaxID=3259518 RepID=UPI00388AA254
MDSIGHRLKVIRLSKKMTQQDPVTENITKGFISLVENGKSNLSVDKFREISYQLNLSSKEIGYLIINNQMLDQKQLLSKLSTAILHDDLYLLNLLYKQETDYFSKSGNIRHKHNIDFIILHIYKIKKIQNTEPLDRILNYLDSVEEWMTYELNLIINLLPFLTEQVYPHWLTKVEHHISNNMESNKLRQTFSKIYMNQIWMILREGQSENLPTVKIYIHETEKLIQDTQLYYDKNKLSFLKGLYTISQGQYQSGLRVSEKAIELMYHFNDEHTARAHSKSLDEFVNIIKEKHHINTFDLM